MGGGCVGEWVGVWVDKGIIKMGWKFGTFHFYHIFQVHWLSIRNIAIKVMVRMN